MATAKFSIGQVNITNYLRLIAREVSNPLAEVANILYAAPHPSIRNITVNSLNPVPHYFDFYETPSSGTIGSLLATFQIDVGLIAQSTVDFFEFTVGGGGSNPSPGDNFYSNSLLNGINTNHIQISQRSYGIRSWVDEIQPYTGGGFEFQGSEIFSDQDRWFGIVYKDVQVPSPIIGNTMFVDFDEITADKTIDASYYNKLIELNGSGDILTITFPNFSTIPDNTVFGFTTHLGAQRYAALTFQTGNTANFLGSAKNIIWLGKAEEIAFIKKSAGLKVMWADGDFRRVGEVIKTEAPLNGISETGGWKTIALYPRLYYWYVSQLDNSFLSAFTGNTVTNPTMWAIDAPNDRFWIPDTGGYFERNLDPDNNVDVNRNSGTNLPGNKQDDEFKSHKHDGKMGEGTGPLSVPDNTTPSPLNSGVRTYQTELTGGDETRPKNILRKAYRII